MKPIKAITNFSYHGKWYEKGDNIPIETVEELIRLNEKGFIEPQTMKDIQDFGKEQPKVNDKEE